ncbi:MAG TPA: carboxylesterase family protein [Rhizomicrobium sp.]
MQSDASETVPLETPAGRLLGLRRQGILEFRGIPYGRPPVGNSRWCWPEPPEAWSGVRDATHFGAVAPQAPTPFDAFLGGALSIQSEDCLHLNVFAPAAANGKWPVMVWIHGGAFVIGAGSQSLYDGSHLAAQGVVVVTLNYRLGALGFLALAPGTGVEGLADQILALDWVRRNIAAFGGDPENVTLFGESAGAMCVGALLTSPRAVGVFHKAILQSGAAHIGHDRERADRVAHALLAALSLAPHEANRAREIPAGTLIKAQSAVLAAAHGTDSQKLGRVPFQPVIDGELLPELPIGALRRGAAREIPILIGTTREEWKLFSAPNPRLRLMTLSGFESRVAHVAGETAPALLRAYNAGSAFERYNAFMTDRAFAVPADRLLSARQDALPTFAYRFDWRAPYLGGIFGSCHALDLGFIFGRHDEGAASAFFGKGAAADALAEAMLGAFAAFAATGDPSTAQTGTWPRYSDETRSTMILGDGPPHVVRALERGRLDAWNAVPDSEVGV